MTDVVVVVNSGSSSLKFALYPVDANRSKPLVRGKVTGIGRSPVLSVVMEGEVVAPTEPLDNIPINATHEWLIAQLLERLTGRYTNYHPVAVGHRVVHGGREFAVPTIIDSAVRDKLERFVPFAPSHQPHNLSAIDAIIRVAPELRQVACFDTSFHRTQSKTAQLFALPRRFTDQGIIRYGFHGLSYEYIASVLPQHLEEKSKGRILVAHLGNGASMCAMRDCRSVATSMGFTALDGLMMGRRSGSIDPGIIIHLIQDHNMSVDEVQHLLYRESGLFGVSGISNNMQVLLDSTEPQAKEAVELFCYRAVSEIGSLVAAMEGLDAIVFTAGIGENAAEIRHQICARLSWLGVEFDQDANQSNATFISSSNSKIDVLVVPTDEEAIIAQHTRALILG